MLFFFFFGWSTTVDRTLVTAGVRVLELLTWIAQRLAAVENRVFWPGAAPNVTSVPHATAPPTTRPGTIGLDAEGNIRLEPLVGRTVLAAGRDLVLELHSIAARLNLTERALASCPCLNTTCRLVWFAKTDFFPIKHR
jgi:hypothetical protein